MKDILVVTPYMYAQIKEIVDNSIIVTNLAPCVDRREELTERINKTLEVAWRFLDSSERGSNTRDEYMTFPIRVSRLP